jgi:hypothetical protein
MLPGLLKTGSESLKTNWKEVNFDRKQTKLPVLVICIKDAALTFLPHHRFNC